jgi:hypothetical protein
MGVYIPPTDTMGVEDLRAAWEACLDSCMPLILGDLNINFGKPRDKWDKIICNLIDDINLVNASRRYTPCRPHRQSTRARWTWRQKREGKMHYSQPYYVLVRKRDRRQFRKVGFRWPRYHDSNHRAVVATIKSGERRLTEYRGKATDRVSEEASGIPAETTPHGAAGRPDMGCRGTESHLRGARDNEGPLA